MDTQDLVDRYSNQLFRMSIVMLGNEADAEDAVQETFYRYLKATPLLQNEEHEKAWLFKVTGNICRDMLRFRSRHKQVSIEELDDYYEDEEGKEILREIIELPEKLKQVIYLHYIEGYSVIEVSRILNISVNIVKKNLQKGRAQLKIRLEGETYEIAQITQNGEVRTNQRRYEGTN
ncbi:MAG: sigma-70 family RNA polymerase sigma factor [Lachnospiraceae bacterium]